MPSVNSLATRIVHSNKMESLCKLIWIDAANNERHTAQSFTEEEAIAYARFLTKIEGRSFAVHKSSGVGYLVAK